MRAPVSLSTSTPPDFNLQPAQGKVDARPGFAEHLKASFDNTNQMQFSAHTAMEELASGKNGNIHETLLAINKAETSFKMIMQVRNKVVNAYQEILRMQV